MWHSRQNMVQKYPKKDTVINHTISNKNVPINWIPSERFILRLRVRYEFKGHYHCTYYMCTKCINEPEISLTHAIWFFDPSSQIFGFTGIFVCILPCHHPNAQNWITSTASKLRRVKNCVSHVGWGLSKRGSASPKVFKLAVFFFWLFFVFLFLFYPQQVIFGNPEKNIPGWITKKSTPFAKIANVKNDLVKNWPGCLVTWS